MEHLQQFIKPELLILVPVIYFIGAGLKHSLFADKYIPLVLGAIGVILSAVYVLATSSVVGYQNVLMALFIALTQGVLVAGASVYVNQLIKQSNKGE